ncbi:MAG: SDR family NAD(P)-dependent oxidoreductase [Clostridia bacterium]|nr:SDR family NAD(P)-dependent oxidoreductase [Clostridia bacterium]
MKKSWFSGEYVIVSGASSGIGKAVCLILVKKYGAKVIGLGRDEEKMLRLQEELGEDRDKFCYRLFDVGERENWLAFRDWLKEEGISPVLVVNNAGAFPTFCRAENTDVAVYEKLLKTNYLSCVYSVEALLPLIKRPKKGLGGIVNVSSSAALCSVVGAAPYSATKAAIKAFTETLAMENKGKHYIGIIYPGTTATDLFRRDGNTEDSILQKVATKPDKMAKKIVRALRRRRRRSVLGADAKAMALLAKVAPVKGLGLIAWVMKISRSKVFTNVFERERKN